MELVSTILDVGRNKVEMNKRELANKLNQAMVNISFSSKKSRLSLMERGKEIEILLARTEPEDEETMARYE